MDKKVHVEIPLCVIPGKFWEWNRWQASQREWEIVWKPMRDRFWRVMLGVEAEKAGKDL